MNEVDLIIHYMRQSKMDAVRRELEELFKLTKSKSNFISGIAHEKFYGILEMFKKASNNAPLP